MWTKFLAILIFIVIPLSAQISVNGTAKDQNDQPVIRASIRIEPSNPALAKEIKTDEKGVFSLNLGSSEGEYFLSISAAGFQEIKREPLRLATGHYEFSIKLAPIEHFDIVVRPEENEISVKYMPLSEKLEGTEIDSSAATRANKLSNILAAIPQVVKDASGKLHPFGNSTDQTNFLLDGFRATDPNSEQFETNISVEAVRSVDIFGGRFSPEFGRGSVATLLYSGMGGNKHERSLTNYFPGIETVKGLALTSWNPKTTFSGPIKQDRAWFFNALEVNYHKKIVRELSEGQDRISSWEATNLSRIQLNLTQKNVLTAGFLANYLNAPRSGLGFLDPLETTLDKRARRKFFNIQDQIITGNDRVITLGYGWYDSFVREIPQGNEPYQIHPSGRSGNAPFNVKRRGYRHQFLANAILGKIETALGGHELKIGADFNYSGICRDTKRTGYRHYRLNGQPSLSVTFGGNGQFCRNLLESALFAQDKWFIKPWLAAEIGIRLDKDAIIPRGILTPRSSITIMPPWFGLDKTKFSVGWGLMPGPTNLGVFTRSLDQYSLNQNFDAFGLPRGEPDLSIFVGEEKKTRIPKTSNFSASIEHNLPSDLRLRADYLRKRSRDRHAFSITNDIKFIPSPGQLPTRNIGTIFYLENTGIEVYDSLGISLIKTFRNPLTKNIRQDDFHISYVRSRSFSNSNASPFIDDPITYPDSAGRTPWDIPNRFLARGSTQIGKKITFFLPSRVARWLPLFGQ